jgi:hypothetical protein
MRLLGRIDWHHIRDGSGRQKTDGDFPYILPEDYIKWCVSRFADSWKNYRLPTWLDQPNRVVVLTEKEADFPVARSILHDLDVEIAYGRGYSGWRPFFEIKEEHTEDKRLIIICLGDFDPSGEDIIRFVEEALEQLGFQDLQVDKIAVTKEQIEKFKLPHKPEDEQEITKLMKDPRYKTWPYGLYRVETAALRNKQPEYFRDLLRGAVLKHLDGEIWRSIREKEKPLKEQVKSEIERCMSRIGDDAI